MSERLKEQRDVDPTADIIRSLYVCDPDVGAQMSPDQLAETLSRLEMPDRKAVVTDLGKSVEELQKARVNLENLGPDNRPLIDAIDRQIALAQVRVQPPVLDHTRKYSRRDDLRGCGALLFCGALVVSGVGGPIASAVLWNEDSQKVSQRVAEVAQNIVSQSCVANPGQELCQATVPLNRITSLDQIDKNSRITGMHEAELAKATQKIEPLFRKEVFDENTDSFRSLVRDLGPLPGLFTTVTSAISLGLFVLLDDKEKGSKKS